MDNEKCFCHFNGYAVKDATARKEIEALKESTANAQSLASEARGISSEAILTAQNAESKVTNANISANEALNYALQSNEKSTEALNTANEAQETANTANENATTALNTVNEMVDITAEKLGWATIGATAISTPRDNFLIEIPNPELVSEIIIELKAPCVVGDAGFSGYKFGMNNIEVNAGSGMTTAKVYFSADTNYCYIRQRLVKASIWSGDDAFVCADGNIDESKTERNLTNNYATLMATARVNVFAIWVKHVYFETDGSQIPAGSTLIVKCR